METYKAWDIPSNYRPRHGDTTYLMTSLEINGVIPPSLQPRRAKIVRLIRKLNENQTIDRPTQKHTQQLFYLETGILGAIALTSLILLITNLRLRNPFPFTWSGYLLFPEEVIAELTTLAHRRQSEKAPQWRIRIEITYEVLLLIWAFYINIQIENIKRPPGGKRSAK
jgi:hypothetical protein